MPTTLAIRHQGEHNGHSQFVVVHLSDGKASEPVSLTPPDKIALPGREHSHLVHDLRWYLEDFLDYPFEPRTHQAQEIQDGLKRWGKETFSSLFRDKARDWYQDARKGNLDQLTLKISSDDPRILAWPWEALHDPEGGVTLAHNCRIERQLNKVYDPVKLPDNLPTDCINILLVIARPYGDQDVGYHALARPLVELSQKQTIPVRVDVLRPPTFDQLCDVLRKASGFYHIVHFDGHGGYGHGDASNQGTSSLIYKGPQGKLVFETPEGKPDSIAAEQLTQLLTEYKIPITVLNACQSAQIDEQADDPFASVAAALLRAGIRSVVAMGYNLYVSAAQQFVPAFYRRLFEEGSVAEATRAGRRAMLAHPQRICSRGEHPLQDWLVPVLYQQDAHDLNFTAASQPQPTQSFALPPEAPEQGDYGFIGRDRAIHALERALYRDTPGILVHGMAGVGKTTLAQGFLQWLQQTDGLKNNPFWFSFNDIRSVESIINKMVLTLSDSAALAAPLEQKLDALCEHFKQHPYILVWDNFESASGIEGTEVTPLLSEADRGLLKDFLHRLRRGKTKVIITSRSSETWLSKTKTDCYPLPLGGLRGEECWEYCNAVVSDLGLALDRSDKTYSELMERLDGHPLAMRAVLLRLEHTPAASLLKELEQGFNGHEHDESTARIYAALNLLETDFATQYQPVLQLIGLHQRYVDLDYLERMLKTGETGTERATIEACLNALERAGLIQPKGQGIYSMHPALNGYLRQQHPATTGMQSAFVDFMGRMADHYAPKQLHEQRGVFYLHGANFHTALSLAMTLNMTDAIAALTQSLAVFAQHNRDFESAVNLYQNLADHCRQHNDDESLAAAYHQLGMIAEEQRDFAQAEQWYLKSLAITEKQNNEFGAALTYHQLGMIAEERRDFAQAEKWYLKSLAITEKQNNEFGAALTYHQLGMIAEERRDFAQAEKWYLKSLAITEKQNNEFGAALTYHQLGSIAQKRRDFAQAEQWYLKSLAIEEKQGNEHGAAQTYHQLGRIAEERRDFAQAEKWYLKSLAITEKQGNEHGAAQTYHQLGMIAQKRRDFAQAEQWYLKSLAIEEKQGNEHGAAQTYHQLGRIAEEQRDFAQAEKWYLKSLAITEKQGNEHGAAQTYHQLGMIAQKRRDFAQAEQWYLKSLAIKEKQNNEFGAALTYAQLGLLEKTQQHWVVAAQWLTKAVVGFANCNDLRFATRAIKDYIDLLQQSDAQYQDEIRQLWQQSGLEQTVGPLDALIQQLKEESQDGSQTKKS